MSMGLSLSQGELSIYNRLDDSLKGGRIKVKNK